MSTVRPRLVRIALLPVILLGILLTADGILPARSAAPNPSWPEVAVGVICLASAIPGFIGIGRKAARHDRQGM